MRFRVIHGIKIHLKNSIFISMSLADGLWNTICSHNIYTHYFHRMGKTQKTQIVLLTLFVKRGGNHCRWQICCRQQMRRPVCPSVVISINNYIRGWQRTPAINCSSCNQILTPLFISRLLTISVGLFELRLLCILWCKCCIMHLWPARWVIYAILLCLHTGYLCS